MKRFGIFVFYDQDGIVDESEEYLLGSFQSIIDRLIILVNGKIKEDSYQTLQRYSNDIICRPNEGYDGGAYKDFFLNILDWSILQDYDELLLVNDTFYGPFYSWNLVFDRMKSISVDFWGLTKHLAFYSPMVKMDVPECIQSYFLVFRKRLFTNDVFRKFWAEMGQLRTFADVVIRFENAMTAFFADAGFSYSAYTDLFPDLEYLKYKEYSAFGTFCYYLLKDCQFPILKKREGVSVFNPQTIPALDYIRDHYNYDLNILWRNAIRTNKKAQLIEGIYSFYQKYTHIYLYGCGIVAQGIESFFSERKWVFDGYIETIPHAKEMNGKPIIAKDDFHFDDDTGVIVAMSRKNTDEVRGLLPNLDSIIYLY